MKKVLQNCGAITAKSTFVKNIAEKKFDLKGKGISLIPYGVDVERFNPNRKGRGVRKKYGIGDEELLILTVQRLEPRKAVEYFIKSIPLILDKEDNVKFMIVGDGSEKEKLMKLSADLKVDDKVIFAGKIPNSEIQNYYAVADIFAFHTIHEGLGIVLLEAIASGKPVVTTIAGGTVDIIKNGVNGFIVKSKDSKSFARAVLKLTNNKKLREELGRNARKISEEKFSWKTVADEYLKIYKKVIK